MPLTSTTRAFCRSNLSSPSLIDCVEPWGDTQFALPPLPDKPAYRAWCSSAGTESCFFNFCEGEVPSLPVGSGNKPHRIHGFVADYDTSGMRPEDFERALRRCNQQFQPYAWNTTFSGGARFVWLFEEPVFYFNAPTYKRFIKRLVRELKVNALAAGFDDTSEQAGRYFTAGAGWTVNPRRPYVRAAALHLWQSETARGDDFDAGVEIPLDVVAVEVEKRFPNRWVGEFAEGARGVRFWDESADALSAIVRKTGMQAFTGDESFLTWERIFGREFVQKYLEDRLGAAIRDIYYDGRAYFRQLHSEQFDMMNTEVAKRHLAVRYGLCPKSGKDENESECDRALHRIETTKRVEGALPFPHNHNRVVYFNGRPHLNISDAKLWPAALDPQEWGENFPWIAAYLSSLFDTPEGLQVFLAWLHVWVKSCYEGSPRKGQALFLVGPPGTGKTLLSTQIISRIVGGFAEATQYLVEGNKYNDAMFEKALLTIDDALAGSDPKIHLKFSALIKAAVANGTFRYERKYGKSLDVPFDGRIMTSLNDDPESLTILPNTDLNLLDKVILLRTGDIPADVAYDVRERYDTIERELGSFVRWVLDYQIPSWIEPDARFGIRAWHEPGLLQETQEVSASSSLIEAVDIWKRDYLVGHPEAAEWMGTPTELLNQLHNCSQTTRAVSRASSVWLGRHLNQAIANGLPGYSRGRRNEDKARVIVIKLK